MTEPSLDKPSSLQREDLSQSCFPQRHRLPDTRESITHKFKVGDHEGYLIVGLFEDGRPGELFLKWKNREAPCLASWTRWAY
jgi:hypothetical protein